MEEEKKDLVPLEDYRAVVKEGDEDYVIHVTGGGKDREIRLSPILYKFGIASIFLSLVILIGACGYSVYSALNVEKNAAVVREIQQAEEIQQEQLLTVSKKAAALSETLHNLTQQEQELRIQAGLKPPKDDKPAEPPAQSEGDAAQVETPPAENTESTSTENSAETAQVKESAPVERPPSVGEFSRINHEHTGQGGPVNAVGSAGNVGRTRQHTSRKFERFSSRVETAT